MKVFAKYAEKSLAKSEATKKSAWIVRQELKKNTMHG